MNSNIQLLNVSTVRSSYSWDYGFPSLTGFQYTPGLGPHNILDQTPIKIEPDIERNGTEVVDVYQTFSPYTKVSLYSWLNFPIESNVVSFVRTVNFHDFYNTKTNEITFEGTNDVIFEHVYIMPGTYKITFSETIVLSSTNLGTYEITPDRQTVKDYMWQWNNLLSGQNLQNPLNREITWVNAKFQRNYSETWRRTRFPCLSGLFNSEGELRNTEAITFQKNEQTLPVEIRVKEISPIVYLSGNQPLNFNERISPLSVVLTPRYIRTGSFPLQEIIWDLGDDTPIFTKTRTQNLLMPPFVYNQALSGDLRDVRNYDVKHTYTKTKNSGFSFYPTITAITSSTIYNNAAKDGNCASYLVGPIGLNEISLSVPLASADRFKLLQSSFEDVDKHVVVGQVYNQVGIWKIDSEYLSKPSFKQPTTYLYNTWNDEAGVWNDNSIWYE